MKYTKRARSIVAATLLVAITVSGCTTKKPEPINRSSIATLTDGQNDIQVQTTKFFNYRTMMSNFVEMLYRQLPIFCLYFWVLYAILSITVRNIYSHLWAKEGIHAYGTAFIKTIKI